VFNSKLKQKITDLEQRCEDLTKERDSFHDRLREKSNAYHDLYHSRKGEEPDLIVEEEVGTPLTKPSWDQLNAAVVIMQQMLESHDKKLDAKTFHAMDVAFTKSLDEACAGLSRDDMTHIRIPIVIDNDGVWGAKAMSIWADSDRAEAAYDIVQDEYGGLQHPISTFWIDLWVPTRQGVEVKLNEPVVDKEPEDD